MLDEVRTQVEAEYGRLGMPSWPNPHPDMAAPRDAEYSRVTDPERYRVVHARARVWAERLGALPGVAVEDVPAGAGRHTRVTSARQGTLPLLLLERPEESLSVLDIAVAEPDVVVATLPDCGCDACDQGSQDLLDAIDLTIAEVVGGPFVVLRADGWRALWHPDGGASSGWGRSPDHDRLMELCRRIAAGEEVRLPRGATAFAGVSWFG